MKIKCPYLASDKYCTYKNGNKHKSRCIYSNAQKCPLFREWADKLSNYQSEEKINKITYKGRIKALIKKWEK